MIFAYIKTLDDVHKASHPSVSIICLVKDAVCLWL